MALFQPHNHTITTKNKQGQHPSVSQQVFCTPTVPDGESMTLKTLPNINNSVISFCLLPKQDSWFLSGRLKCNSSRITPWNLPLPTPHTGNPFNNVRPITISVSKHDWNISCWSGLSMKNHHSCVSQTAWFVNKSGLELGGLSGLFQSQKLHDSFNKHLNLYYNHYHKLWKSSKNISNVH